MLIAKSDLGKQFAQVVVYLPLLGMAVEYFPELDYRPPLSLPSPRSTTDSYPYTRRIVNPCNESWHVHQKQRK